MDLGGCVGEVELEHPGAGHLAPEAAVLGNEHVAVLAQRVVGGLLGIDRPRMELPLRFRPVGQLDHIALVDPPAAGAALVVDGDHANVDALAEREARAEDEGAQAGLLDDPTVLPVGAGLLEVLRVGPALQDGVVVLLGRGLSAGDLGLAALHAVEPCGGAVGVVGGDLDAEQDGVGARAVLADVVDVGVDPERMTGHAGPR